MVLLEEGNVCLGNGVQEGQPPNTSAWVGLAEEFGLRLFQNNKAPVSLAGMASGVTHTTNVGSLGWLF